MARVVCAGGGRAKVVIGTAAGVDVAEASHVAGAATVLARVAKPGVGDTAGADASKTAAAESCVSSCAGLTMRAKVGVGLSTRWEVAAGSTTASGRVAPGLAGSVVVDGSSAVVDGVDAAGARDGVAGAVNVVLGAVTASRREVVGIGKVRHD